MSTTSSSSSTTTTTSSSSSGTPSDDERPGLDEQPLHDDNELNRELHQEEHTNEEQKPPEPAPPAQPTQQPAQKPKPRQKRKDDFILGTVLGQGAFGQVLEVEDKETHKHYAMKVLSKMHIMREKKMNYVTIERDVMTKLNHPNIVRLLLTFQDPGNLFYVVELAENGDLQKVLNEKHSLDKECAKVILGQVLLAIAHMHKHGILHRDLKPENILLDKENRVKLTDFGTAKIFDQDKEFKAERGSFVGSADYVSPETLKETTISPSTDLWSYGCIIYALFVGDGPFHTESSYATFQKIENNEYSFPDYFPEDAKDLVTKLLKSNYEERLGNDQYNSDYEPIRNHPFFEGINWETLPKQAPPELKPFSGKTTASTSSSQQTTQQEIKQEVHTEAKTETQEIPQYEVKNSPMAQFLLAGEHIVFEGDIVKTVRLLSKKKRRLVLTDRPRLFYVDLKDNVVKGSIPLAKDTVVSVKSKGKWEITVKNPDRVYNLSSETEQEAQQWQQKIDEIKNKL